METYDAKAYKQAYVMANFLIDTGELVMREDVLNNIEKRMNKDYYFDLNDIKVNDILPDTEKILAGTGYEDALDGYYDVLGAALKVKELGYENIYIQGHSLGSTKALYTYKKLKEENNEILKNIKGLILLSLVDINTVMKVYLGDKFQYYLDFAQKREQEGHLKYLMPPESFIHPISVKTYLRYLRDYKQIDIDNYDLVSIIDIPVFMRWGTDNEMTIYKPEELIELVSSKIKHNNKDINCIFGANHSYDDYEEELGKQIVGFVTKK